MNCFYDRLERLLKLNIYDSRPRKFIEWLSLSESEIPQNSPLREHIQWIKDTYGAPFVSAVENIRKTESRNDIGSACIEYMIIRGLVDCSGRYGTYPFEIDTRLPREQIFKNFEEDLFGNYKYVGLAAAAVLSYRLKHEPKYLIEGEISFNQDQVEALKRLYPSQLGELLANPNQTT